MQVPLLAGRFFTENDTADHPGVAIVNESFARHFCGNAQSCVGRMMSTHGDGGGLKLDTLIVGVVHNAKHEGIREAVDPTCFQPLKQSPNPARLFLYVRTFTDPAQMLSTGATDDATARPDARTGCAAVHGRADRRRPVQ